GRRTHPAGHTTVVAIAAGAQYPDPRTVRSRRGDDRRVQLEDRPVQVGVVQFGGQHDAVAGGDQYLRENGGRHRQGGTELAEAFDDEGRELVVDPLLLRHHAGAGPGVAEQVKGEFVAERGLLGAAVLGEASPASGDLGEFCLADFGDRGQQLGEGVEETPPVPLVHSQEQVFLRLEVHIDRAPRVAGGSRDVIEARRTETLGGEYLLRRVDEQGTGVLGASFPSPALHHRTILPKRKLAYG